MQEASLWMVSHLEKVEQWRNEGRHGENKLRNACRQRCLTVIAQARRRHNRETGHDNQFYYTAAMLREILPDIFDHDDWVMSARGERDEQKGPSRPAEGNNRLAMICDVRQAFYGLPEKDRMLLEELHRDGGLDYGIVAIGYDVHERTIRRREQRILEKMLERLGGEPPFYRV
jgi:DNA-directed RNA polymerase specialized sigma24 family protein